MLKDYTGREIYEAMEKNGLETVRNKYVDIDSDGKIVAGCILTQAANNLHTLPASARTLNDFTGEYAVSQDEESEFALLEQLNNFTVPEDSRWFYMDYSRPAGLGTTIIHWYDRKVWEDRGTLGEQYVYLLDTYKESLAMAKELLEPVFDKVFTLEVRDSWVFQLWEKPSELKVETHISYSLLHELFDWEQN